MEYDYELLDWYTATLYTDPDAEEYETYYCGWIEGTFTRTPAIINTVELNGSTYITDKNNTTYKLGISING